MARKKKLDTRMKSAYSNDRMTVDEMDYQAQLMGKLNWKKGSNSDVASLRPSPEKPLRPPRSLMVRVFKGKVSQEAARRRNKLLRPR